MANNSKNEATTIDIKDRPVMYRLLKMWMYFIPSAHLTKICKNLMRHNTRKGAVIESMVIAMEDYPDRSLSDYAGWLKEAREACPGINPKHIRDFSKRHDTLAARPMSDHP